MGASGTSSQPQGERALVQRVLAGDASAQAELDAILRRVARSAFVRVQRTHGTLPFDEGDLAQEAHALVLADEGRVLRAFLGESALSTYLFTPVYRRALRLAQRRRETPREQAEDDLVSEAPSPEQQVAAARAARAVWALVPQLTPKEQALVRLEFGEGLESAETAAVLGVSASGVRVLRKRALDRLRALLGAGTKGDETLSRPEVTQGK